MISFAALAAFAVHASAPQAMAEATPAAPAVVVANTPAPVMPPALPPAAQGQNEAQMAPAAGAPAAPAVADDKKALIDAADAVTRFNEADVVGHAKPWQMYYQPAESDTMKQVEPLHDAVLVIITVIVVIVMVLMLIVMVRYNKRANPKPQTFTHNKMVEIIWTVIPILILVGIAIPSLRIHYKYYNNESIIQNPDVTVKVLGHQWYWSYEYPDLGIAYDSNITADKDLPPGAPRLLEVDNALVVPVNKVVRVQMTSADVIHAWVVPSFGIKKGAVPGRLNETWFKAEKEGIYYGQCSVLCGKLHGFMPIKVIVVSQEKFDTWVKGAKLKYAANESYQFAALNK